MSAPPPGFNEQASHLPDPGAAAAPIHVMRGGGGQGGNEGGNEGEEVPQNKEITNLISLLEDDEILEEYGLTNPLITQHIKDFDDSFKETFITQIRSGECVNKGNSITKKDCWAVTAVIRALLKQELESGILFSFSKTEPDSAAAATAADHPDEIRGLANASEPAEEATLAPCERPEETGTKLPGADGTDSVDPSRMSGANVVNAANVEVIVPGAAAPAPAPAPAAPLGRGPAAAAGKPEFEEMGLTSDFRKGQYGINLNANNSQRFYANALVGTKRLRIRGRNAANIKGKYNTKTATLKQAARNANAAAATARERARVAAEAREAAKQTTKLRRTEASQAQAEKRTANVAAVQTKRATGQKLNFKNRLTLMNPMRLVNRFKRGGSRKTRRSTRRNRRR